MGAWAGGAAQLKLGKEALKDQRAANRDLTRRMEASRGEYLAQRPANSLGRQYALQNMLGLYGPANEMLGEMMGQGQGPLDLQRPTQRWPDMMAALQQTQPIAPPQQQMARPAEPPPAPGWSSVGREVSPVQLAGERATSAAVAQASPQLAALRRGIR